MQSLPCHNIPEHYRISIKSNIKLIYFGAVEMIISITKEIILDSLLHFIGNNNPNILSLLKVIL